MNRKGIVIGGLSGAGAGRELASLEVQKIFPNFHETHGYNHETFAAIIFSLLGATAGYAIEKFLKKKEVAESLSNQ